MKKVLISFMFLLLFVFVLSGASYSFQGRMGGMGDPYGLVEDEADFLIHPAKIAKGEGVKFYSHYRFLYTGVLGWDYDLDVFNTSGTLTDYNHFDTSGQEYKHNALLGAAFPLGSGRMGLFFTYDGMRGDYDGNDNILASYAEYDLTKNLDNFALRLLYGLPVGGVDVGVELGMAYRNEKQQTWIYQPSSTFGAQNYIWPFSSSELCLFPFMIPYDSQYWELLWRAGTEVKLAALGSIMVNLRGGAIVSSDNEYHYVVQQPLGTITYDSDMNGDVAGWCIGSDIWMRVPGGNPTLTFPVLVSFDYAEKKRDGEGIGTGSSDAGSPYDYTHKEQSLDLKAGGGIEKKLGGNALIAAGIYYNYLQGSDDLLIIRNFAVISDGGDVPSRQEHRAILRLAGEKEFSSTVTLRMGLTGFFGWINEEFELGSSWYTDDISLDGFHWGIGASLGGTIKIPPITLEPFINGGWHQYDLDGDGDRTNAAGMLEYLLEMDKSRSEWSIGGGFSVLFGL